MACDTAPGRTGDRAGSSLERVAAGVADHGRPPVRDRTRRTAPC